MDRFCAGCLKPLPDEGHIELPGKLVVCFERPLEYEKIIETPRLEAKVG